MLPGDQNPLQLVMAYRQFEGGWPPVPPGLRSAALQRELELAQLHWVCESAGCVVDTVPLLPSCLFPCPCPVSSLKLRARCALARWKHSSASPPNPSIWLELLCSAQQADPHRAREASPALQRGTCLHVPWSSLPHCDVKCALRLRQHA